MLSQQIVPIKMNLFRKLIDFLEGNDNSLRFDIINNRVSDGLRYITIADSKREMRNDFRNLNNDFNVTMNHIYEYGKEGRTK